MEILKRSEAIQLKIGQYFTGVPCKNGHTTYRYTASGACSQCVARAAVKTQRQSRSGPNAAPEDIEAIRAIKRQREVALLEVLVIKVLADVADLKVINETAVLMGMAHGTCLTDEDFGGIRSARAGTPLYILRVHQLDADTIYKTAAALWSMRTRPEELPHIARLKAMETELNDKPLPDWTERP